LAVLIAGIFSRPSPHQLTIRNHCHLSTPDALAAAS
jgi:hypothetical protein